MPKRANGRSLDSAARSGGRDGPHGVAVEAYPRLRAASSVTTDLEDVAERVRLRHHVVDAVRDTGYLEVLAGDVFVLDVDAGMRQRLGELESDDERPLADVVDLVRDAQAALRALRDELIQPAGARRGGPDLDRQGESDRRRRSQRQAAEVEGR